MTTRKYDSTVARMAGNLLSGVLDDHSYYVLGAVSSIEDENTRYMVRGAVRLARAIVAETKRQEDAETEQALDSASVAVNADR